MQNAPDTIDNQSVFIQTEREKGQMRAKLRVDGNAVYQKPYPHVTKTNLPQLLFPIFAFCVCLNVAHADMMTDSPVTFPERGALRSQYPPDQPAKENHAMEKGYYIFKTPERSLAQIEQIQARMIKGTFTPPLPDWPHLQRTRRILTEGGELRLLALGDSIVNDTIRSGWVAKLQEAYPKANIRATVYVRGGGGCQHYRKNQRITKNVIPRKPDLVFIGGISQRSIEDIREVIHQLRTALPDVEILLATGIFGTTDPRDPEALAKAAYSGTGTYGRSLHKLATEERCAYLEMTSPWAEYIRSAKVHPHLFYRDRVHANEFGEQILSKILMAFFRDTSDSNTEVTGMDIPADDQMYYHEEQYMGKDISVLVSKLPFAYYPSINKLEVALSTPKELRTDEPPTRVEVKVLSVDDDRVVARGTVPLDSAGRGQAIIDLPDLPDGEYAVEYNFGTGIIRSPKTFRRMHFPWENNSLGVSHKVWPPFTPVEVRGETVSVVGRTYRINGFGVFDSVISQGRELLAGPMHIVCETAEGRMQWGAGHVSGTARHDDQAVFDCRVECPAVKIAADVNVEEDGCAIIRMQMSAGDKSVRINKMWIEIPLKDTEARLFHFTAANAMRLNYGGSTPRGHNIRWDLETQGWRPSLWSSLPGPDDPVVWDSTRTKLWHNENYGERRPFVPYIHLGGVERGLAWFGETDRGYVVDYKQPVQVLRREPGRIILDIYLVQRPLTFAEGGQRTIVFGLQASPTKPMEKDWRTRTINHGVGCVVCWGGYVCASKYPDGRDFKIVDKIQEARRTGKVDTDWFAARDKMREHPERKCFDRQPWLENVLNFAKHAANAGRYPGGSGCYFEEHAMDTREQEWEVFQDEWSMRDFARFQDKPSNWGVSRRSYQDFALYYANEFMKRGVSLYFDNTNIKNSRNRRFSDAYTDAGGKLRWASEIFGARRYYKRIWKLAQELNTRGAEYPIDITFHMTNTDELPFATWCSAVLELEQSSFTDPDGRHIPWPPDYVQAVLMNRRAGAVSIALDTLTGDPRHDFNKHPPEVRIAHWAMCRIHGNIRLYHDWYKEYQECNKFLFDFGFGTPDVTDYYYWDSEQHVQITDESVIWMYLTRKQQPSGLIVLQSYRADGARTEVTVSGAVCFRDCQSGKIIDADPDGSAEISLPGRYTTKMFYIDTRK